MIPDEEYLLKYGDPRMEAYPLMDSPQINICIILAYFLCVKYIGPAWMKNREPYDLRHIMIVYNLFISVLSAWMFLNFGIYGWFTKYRFRCEPIDFSHDQDALKNMTDFNIRGERYPSYFIRIKIQMALAYPQAWFVDFYNTEPTHFDLEKSPTAPPIRIHFLLYFPI
ncbi:elongation of very long chain fatty acids protein [Nephila pilipes]|uniref:Elongation of very long chain fatty acids protein n=1 Tax=Nephila pilipes TaxID=299642 RepID=A0A8X6NEH2_NEPPI|nr:elongation of very long chain fatty acids protein [Nephila pilipes]